ncbi:hypothetical protein [Microcoleus sp. D3_18a_C4]|uniref:hypothetical protein n=1 Tax=unclassified Microcoleus TaxID=2642155 RepID=UPI002FD4C832
MSLKAFFSVLFSGLQLLAKRTEQERQRADRERLRAEKLAEKLRQAGIELDDEE